MRYREINRSLAAKIYRKSNEEAAKKFNETKLEESKLNKKMTEDELRKAEVEKEMQRIRAIAKYRQAASAELLKRQEEEQKVKIEALRQKLRRERQAQIIKEMQERNAVEHKATVKAAQMAARKEQEAREAGRTSDFNLEEKRKKMMDAYYTQQDKVKARKLMGTEVDLELAEDDLKETKAAQERMEQTEKYMQELREEQAKKIEEEKAQKTNAIQNIFKKLTSWPRRKIPTQEELNSDSIKEETATVNTAESKETTDEKATETLRTAESTSSIKEEVTSRQEQSYQERVFQELCDAHKKSGMTQETIDEVISSVEEENKEKRRKISQAATLANKFKKAIKQYTSNQPVLKEGEKQAKNNELNKKYGRFEIDHEQALEMAQRKKEKEATPYYRPGWGR